MIELERVGPGGPPPSGMAIIAALGKLPIAAHTYTFIAMMPWRRAGVAVAKRQYTKPCVRRLGTYTYTAALAVPVCGEIMLTDHARSIGRRV